ncbi:aconitate hydratase AcnA [Aliiglaciecola sp. CAU 1673]|uniref:aconitate hydratase AcnA n=1 Tax=Aliiglaciecola sp. CAU 1673 TaxID=3032595 RepID=UPI0023DB6797|nr:aconitate hydratase AcnA [Aliiglaciecola sp. CAU 1673]MDF2180051.1 aconitate hydratase AcnA [Aliiglaciecola sp. CAU 1673]
MSKKYQAKFEHQGKSFTYFPFSNLPHSESVESLPYCLKILLENLLRHADQDFVSEEDIQALVNWQPKAQPDREIAFVPSRVLLQDFTGVPAIVDLAAMRDAMEAMGKAPEAINPLSPVELVIDHSVMVDIYGCREALAKNTEIEMQRNQERYQFLRWGSQAFDNFKVVPPGTGIVHQVNLEYLARLVFAKDEILYPDTLVGTDSHTTMINGLGVLGWGVGGIEAEAAMLGQPISMLIPQVVGVRMQGQMPEGVTATDLVLTVTEKLRKLGVVGKFVEFFGPGLAQLSLADRATIANMAPEYGATCGIFPVDEETLSYLRLTGRREEHIELVRRYMQEMGLWHDEQGATARYSDSITIELDKLEPSLAGPKRPQDRIALSDGKAAYAKMLAGYQEDLDKTIARFEDEGGDTAVGHDVSATPTKMSVEYQGQQFDLKHGDVVIAAITSCTNTSNPAVLMAAGLLARNANALGLKSKPWVKTSLAPGSQVVTDYLERAGLMEQLEALGFYLVGYGCTTCIGNAGPLPEPVADAIQKGKLLVASVLSGNRNFEGRIHPEVRANYLASPPLVVAYALAGTMDIDLYKEPLGKDKKGNDIFLLDIWPSAEEIQQAIHANVSADKFQQKYAEVFKGDSQWRNLSVQSSTRYPWPDSSYVRKPPFFEGMKREPQAPEALSQARCLVKVGDSITTDHISPAGSIKADSPAGRYLQEQGIVPKDFNSYGSRRGNHEVMMRGTFANVRLKNLLVPHSEGSWTKHFPSDEEMSIFDAAMKYQQDNTPLLVLAGEEYGTGSSRDWAAKGPALLGVRCVIAQSYERIHRSNLVGMGILPLQYMEGESADSLGLKGDESFDIESVGPDSRRLKVKANTSDGKLISFETRVRIDTANEYQYYRHGGILHYVLRRLAGQ